METAGEWDKRTVCAESILFGGIRSANRQEQKREGGGSREAIIVSSL